MKSSVEVNLDDRRTTGRRETELEDRVPKVSQRPDAGHNKKVQRPDFGEIKGVQLKSTKNKMEKNSRKEIEMKFAKCDGKIVTVDEIDEALASEGKNQDILEGMNRNLVNAIVYLKDDIDGIGWRNVKDFPIKVSNNAIYLGVNSFDLSNTKVRLSGLPPWFSRDDIVE